MNKVKELRNKTGLSQSKFAAQYGITVRTLQGWEAGRNIPEYVLTMLTKLVAVDGVNTTMWAFTEYRDAAGTGRTRLFKNKGEAIRCAEEEWNHLSESDQSSYDPEAGDWFMVSEVPVAWDETDEEFVPEICDLDPVWSAL